MKNHRKALFRNALWIGGCLAMSAGALAASQADKHALTQRAIEQLESTPEHKKLAAAPLKKAKEAQERAADAAAAGDAEHAAMLEDVALEWAQTAVDLTRAAEKERKLVETQRQAAEAEAKIVRARALIETAVARKGRAEEKLEQLKEQGAPVDATLTHGERPAPPQRDEARP